MDPTTKAGRDKMLIDLLENLQAEPEDYVAIGVAAVSHIDKLERERDEAERLYTEKCGQRYAALVERDKLRAALERAREALREIGPRISSFLNIVSDGPDDSDVAMAVRKLREARDIANGAALANPSATPNGSAAPYEPSEAEIKAAADNLFINVRDRLVSDDGALTHRMKQWEEVAGLALIAAANARRTP